MILVPRRYAVSGLLSVLVAPLSAERLRGSAGLRSTAPSCFKRAVGPRDAHRPYPTMRHAQAWWAGAGLTVQSLPGPSRSL